jgi:hypothetical protein
MCVNEHILEIFEGFTTGKIWIMVLRVIIYNWLAMFLLSVGLLYSALKIVLSDVFLTLVSTYETTLCHNTEDHISVNVLIHEFTIDSSLKAYVRSLDGITSDLHYIKHIQIFNFFF